MPALQALVVTDRAATPVNYTLIPNGPGPEKGFGVVAASDATGTALSEKRLVIGRRISGNRIRTVEKWSFPVIVTETINGVSVPTTARVAYVDVTFNFDRTHTEQERKDVVGMVYSAHAPGKVLVEDTVVKNQDVW
jgi:hypothetical protein